MYSRLALPSSPRISSSGGDPASFSAVPSRRSADSAASASCRAPGGAQQGDPHVPDLAGDERCREGAGLAAVVGGPVLGAARGRVGRSGRGEPGAEGPLLTEQHDLDAALRGTVQERRAQPHPAEAHHLPDPAQAQSQQRLVSVGDDEPVATGSDVGALAVDIDDRLQRMRGALPRVERGDRDGLPEEAHTVVEGGDVALARVELQPQVLQLGARGLQRPLTVEAARHRDGEIVAVADHPEAGLQHPAVEGVEVEVAQHR